jgi:hypothetical protein
MNILSNLVVLFLAVAVAGAMAGFLAFLGASRTMRLRLKRLCQHITPPAQPSFFGWCARAFFWLKQSTNRPGLFALLVLALYAAFNCLAQQNLSYQLGDANLPAITPARCYYLHTTNDSSLLILEKANGTNVMSNDIFDAYIGSTPIFSVGAGGAITNLGTNAASNSLAALGVEWLTNTFPSNGPINLTSYFPTPYASGSVPIVVLNHSSNVMWVTSVTSNYVIVTNALGTNLITGIVIGQPPTGH